MCRLDDVLGQKSGHVFSNDVDCVDCQNFKLKIGEKIEKKSRVCIFVKLLALNLGDVSLNLVDVLHLLRLILF